MKHFLMSVVLCVLVIALGTGVTYALITLNAKNKAVTDAEKSDTITNVKVEVIRPVVLDDLLVLTGRIDAWKEVVLSAEVAGNIEWQGVEEGDRVRRGQELLRIDTTWYQTAHDQALAQDLLAAQELERAQRLRESGVSSPQELDRALAQQKVAAADLAAAKTQLGKTVVAAPIDGIIDTLEEERSEWASKGEALVRLVQVDRVKAMVGVPERDIRHFKLGDEVTVIPDALPEHVFTGTIYRMATSADKTTRTFETEIELDNAAALLKPGMTIRAHLVRGTYPDAIVIPIFAVLSLENQRFVVVEQGGVAHLRPVQIGVLRGDHVQITEGLEPGDRLIVVGQRDLRDGEPVRVMAEGAE